MPRQANTLKQKSSSKRKKERKEQSLVFNCTSCAQPQLLVQGKRNILSHPKLQVGVCRECLIFAHSDLVPKDDEGYEIYCEWCCELGNLICCDQCKAPYCEECISRNIGVEYFESIPECEEWRCFACDPSSIEDLRELTKAVLDHQNYGEPTDLLLEKCSAVFTGDPDINDSDREEIVKERIRLRRNNLNESMKKKKNIAKAKNEMDNLEEEEEEEDEKSEDPPSDKEHPASSDEETLKSRKIKTKNTNGNSKAKQKSRKNQEKGSVSDDDLDSDAELNEDLPEDETTTKKSGQKVKSNDKENKTSTSKENKTKKSEDEESLPSLSLSDEPEKEPLVFTDDSDTNRSSRKENKSTSNKKDLKLKKDRSTKKRKPSVSSLDSAVSDLSIDEEETRTQMSSKRSSKVGKSHKKRKGEETSDSDSEVLRIAKDKKQKIRKKASNKRDYSSPEL